MSILDQIKLEMKLQHVSQFEMSERILTSQPVISSWFTGRKCPRYDNLINMADALNCDIVLVRRS